MCGGGGIPIVSDVVDFVGDTLDKADNWTEGAGEMLADIDPGPALGDALASFDEEVLQKADIGTVASIAAVATGNAYLVPYITAANTAAKGGDFEDIVTSFGISYATTNFAPDVGKYVQTAAAPAVGDTASKILAEAAKGAFTGAGAGAGTAAAFDKSIGEFATRGAVVGGVTGAISSGVSEGYKTIKNELGIGSTYSPNLQEDADFLAAQAESARAAGAGQDQIEMILKQEGVDPFAAADVAGLTASGIGEKAVAQNIAAGYQPTELYTPPPLTESELERQAKKKVSDALSKETLEAIYGTPTAPSATMRFRVGRGLPGQPEPEALSASGGISPTQVGVSNYELRRFQNDAGQSALVSFKDGQPQTPIPPGYRQVEVIGAAEGGLIDSSKTTMVKYSKKPLLAPRKKVTKPKKEKIASKGLAVKK